MLHDSIFVRCGVILLSVVTFTSRVGVAVLEVSTTVTARSEFSDSAACHICKDAVSFPVLAFGCFCMSPTHSSFVTSVIASFVTCNFCRLVSPVTLFSGTIVFVLAHASSTGFKSHKYGGSVATVWQYFTAV